MSAINYICRACRRCIEPGTGYVHVDGGEVYRVERAAVEWERRQADLGRQLYTNLADLLDYPEPAEWMTHHEACDPRPDAGDYWFSIESISSLHGLLHDTAHLMGKAWLEYTDWDDFIRRAAVEARHSTVACPTCKAPAGVACTIGRTASTDRTTHCARQDRARRQEVRIAERKFRAECGA